MSLDDEIRLRHMLEAAREAQSFVTGKTRNDLDADRKLTLALIKEVEIIGEAAANLSDRCREQFPEIPWADIIGMRHRLVHAYFDVNLDVVWSTATKELPHLLRMLEEVLPPEREVD